MPLPPLERARALQQAPAWALAVCLLLTPGGAWSKPEPLSGPIYVPSGPQHTKSGPRVQPPMVRKALKSLASDPNVVRGEKTWLLTWAHHDAPAPRPRPEWAWFGALFGSMGEAIRVLMWVAAAIGAGLLGVYLRRLAQLGTAHGALTNLRRPTQVQDLDIRPESLPADVGAAALDLWDRGERRAALALLYRGMLSRLVHVHAAPIRASSTEEECAQAAATRLAGAPLDYVRGLIAVWQRAVYGGSAPPPERFQGLCAGLDTSLAATVPDTVAGTSGRSPDNAA